MPDVGETQNGWVWNGERWARVVVQACPPVPPLPPGPGPNFDIPFKIPKPFDGLPLADGVADPGVIDEYSRGDHVHPGSGGIPGAVNIKTDFGAVGDGVTVDDPAFLAFQAWAVQQPPGVVLMIPPGSYNVTPVALQAAGFRGGGLFYRGIKDLTIFAYGATLANFYVPDPFIVDPIANVTARIASTKVGDTTGTLLNGADAAKFAVNDWVAVTSLEMQGRDLGYPANWYNFDYVQVAAISGTTVTFSAALLRTHLSTFPLSGPGTSNPTYDWGGPATIVRISPTWDQSVRVYGMTVTGHTNCTARKMEMIDCNIAGYVGHPANAATASCSREVVFRRCHIGPGIFELDKNIGIIKFIDSAIDTLSVQSASVETLVVDGCKILTTMRGTAKNTHFKDSHIQNFQLSPTIGWSKTVSMDGCRIGKVTYADAEHYINLSAVSFSNGTFSAPVSNTSNYQAVQRVAIPGTVMYFNYPGGFTGNVGNLFIITKAYSDVNNIYFDTTLSQIPVYVPAGFVSGQPTAIAVHPGIRINAASCTGCIDVQMWSQQAKAKPIWSYAHRVYSDNISGAPVGTGTDQPPVWGWGALVSLTINVVRPYTGTVPMMHMNQCGPYGAYAIQMATNTFSQYRATVDLRVAGSRVITPSGVTGAAGTDTLPAPVAGNIWFVQDALDPLLTNPYTTETPAQMPIVEIELVTDQGVTSLIYDGLAHA